AAPPSQQLRRPPLSRPPRPPPAGRPAARPPGGSLRDHAAALGAHAVRLRGAAAWSPGWQGRETEALRAEVENLAARCATAAGGLALAAAQLRDP
ncbi:hypothetical protein AB0F21_34560, partial [Streptomyces virginiae]